MNDIPNLVTHLDPRNYGLTVQLSEQAANEINAKFRERMAEVLTVCRLRPIAEMPKEAPERCLRLHWGERCGLSYVLGNGETHFIDIALPPTYPADFEKAFAESKLDAEHKPAAFKLWKGGV